MNIRLLVLLGIVVLAGCQSPSLGGGVSRAAATSSYYGYATSGSVSASTATNFGTLATGTPELTVSNNDWGIPQNGQGGSTSFTETINGASALGWAYSVTNGTNVCMYPEVGYGWSPNGNNSWGGNPVIGQVSDNRLITSNVNIKSTHSAGSTWDLAYDIWITPAQHGSTVQGSYELMIWLDHANLGPWANSTPPQSASIDGVYYSAYTNAGVGSGWTVLSYINQGAGIYQNSRFNISDVVKDAAARFGIPGNFYVSSIEFGNEVVNGSGITEITGWTVNVGAPGSNSGSGGGGTGTGSTSLPGQVQASSYQSVTGTLKLEPCSDTGGGQDLGYTSVGATATYGIAVSASGAYTAQYRVASAQGGSFDVLIDGAKVDTVTVANTGGWQTWTTMSGSTPYQISAGNHTLSIVTDSVAYNLNWVAFASSGSGIAANFSLNSWQFSSSQGVTSWNGGVGNFVPGTWIEFNGVNLSSGYNNCAVSYATAQSGSFNICEDSPSGTVIGTVSYGSSGGWNTYIWGGCNLNASLAKGTHNVYFVPTSGAANLAVMWFKNQ
jgi:hypothetical protein